jgi:LPXTG-site transpeptidase (sortase) family protein
MADDRVASNQRRRLSRRAFIMLVPALPLVIAGCSVAHADSATPNPSTPGAVPRPTKAPTRTNTRVPTRTPATASPTPLPTVTPTATPAPSAVASRSRATDSIQIPPPQRLPPERILVPRVGIDSKIVRIETKLDSSGNNVWETAAFAVGHHRGSVNPGERGNIVLSGHISSVHEGAVFKRLPEIVAGDAIVLVTAEQNYLYQVTRLQTVTPDHIDALNQTSDETLTALTCVPDGVYTHRLIVTAKRV